MTLFSLAITCARPLKSEALALPSSPRCFPQNQHAEPPTKCNICLLCVVVMS
jgi:hypothetical protein